MEVTLTTMITAILGFCWVGLGLSMVINPKAVHEAVESLYKSPGMMFIVGLMSMILGALIIVFHMKWRTTWETVITVIGVVSFLKGVSYMALPQSMSNMKTSMLKGVSSVRAWGILTLAIGLAFLYLSVL